MNIGEAYENIDIVLPGKLRKMAEIRIHLKQQPDGTWLSGRNVFTRYGSWHSGGYFPLKKWENGKPNREAAIVCQINEIIEGYFTPHEREPHREAAIHRQIAGELTLYRDLHIKTKQLCLF